MWRSTGLLPSIPLALSSAGAWLQADQGRCAPRCYIIIIIIIILIIIISIIITIITNIISFSHLYFFIIIVIIIINAIIVIIVIIITIISISYYCRKGFAPGSWSSGCGSEAPLKAIGRQRTAESP